MLIVIVIANSYMNKKLSFMKNKTQQIEEKILLFGSLASLK